MSDKLISIVIPTRNEERNIERCLASIINNGYPKYEIIVVDQNSTDKTKLISEKFKAKFISVPKTNIYQPPSQSRNIGFKQSTGEYIYHIDADMELEKSLLSEINAIFKDLSISAVIVPEIDVPKNTWARAKAFERSFLYETDSEAARVSRRKVFEKTMYDSNISSGEDWDIHEKFKKYGKIARSKKSVFHHLGKISIVKEFKKKLSYGKASSHYTSKRTGSLVTKFFKMFYVYSKNVLFNLLKDPVVVICFVILRSVDVIGLFLGLALSKIKPRS